MTEEDFEIDVYGDAEGGHEQHNDEAADDFKHEEHEHEQHDENGDENGDEEMDRQQDDCPIPKQGTKRKQDEEMPVDQNATSAVQVSELQWWDTEDEIRGWAATASCEDELIEITFSEHKVNGKSKG